MKRPTKKDLIVNELRHMIESGQLQRGDRLHQGELAKALNTSITPVREALRELEAQGVLTGEPHRGVRVAEIDIETIKGVYVLRRLVEPYAMQRAAMRVSRRDIANASALNDAMREAHSVGEDETTTILNRRFHFVFYERTGLPQLEAQIESLWQAFPWDILKVISSRVEKSVAEHQAMLEAIDSGDMTALAEACETHLWGGFTALRLHVSGVAEDVDDPFDPANDA